MNIAYIKIIFNKNIVISKDEININNKHKYPSYAICDIARLMYYNRFDHRWYNETSEKIMYKNGFLQIYEISCVVKK